jgi:hypothetical protein
VRRAEHTSVTEVANSSQLNAEGLAQPQARVLTKPGTPAGNDGCDNAANDLILAVNDTLLAPSGRRCARALSVCVACACGGRCGCGRAPQRCRGVAHGLRGERYASRRGMTPHCAPAALLLRARRLVVLDMLGCGTFGQVVKCRCSDTGEVCVARPGAHVRCG